MDSWCVSQFLLFQLLLSPLSFRWYYKGRGSGVKEWVARPDVFPHGAESVFNATEWPVVAHNRMWSADTVYAKANGGKWDFIVEQDLAMPVDQARTSPPV